MIIHLTLSKEEEKAFNEFLDIEPETRMFLRTTNRANGKLNGMNVSMANSRLLMEGFKYVLENTKEIVKN